MSDSLQPIMAQPCQPSCPVAAAAAVIEGKWTTLVIRDLMGGTRRFSELLRSLDGVSPKVLTQRLRLLEELGLIHKEITPSIPPRTDYSLTPLGWELRPLIESMAVFGLKLQVVNP